MATHKFGILNQYEPNKLYFKYEPEKYNCISVHMYLLDFVLDNYLNEWMK